MGFLDRKKQSEYERRLKDLKKEAELVRGDIRALSKAVRKPEEFEGLPKLKSTRFQRDAVPAPSRKDPVKVPNEPPPRVTTGAEKPGDLFGWAGAAGQSEQGSPMAGHGRGDLAQAEAQRQRAAAKDERFANYFSSGNFLGGTKPMKQEKNVQRNKAVFMVVIVILVAFSVFRLMFR